MLVLGGWCKLGPLYFGGLGSMDGVGACGEVACEGYLGGVCVFHYGMWTGCVSLCVLRVCVLISEPGPDTSRETFAWGSVNCFSW